jgi:hypothetical protein
VAVVVGRRWAVCIPRGHATHATHATHGALATRGGHATPAWRRGVADCGCVSDRYCSRSGRMVLGCGGFGVAWMPLVGGRSLTFPVLGWGCWGEY